MKSSIFFSYILIFQSLFSAATVTDEKSGGVNVHLCMSIIRRSLSDVNRRVPAETEPENHDGRMGKKQKKSGEDR